LTNTNTTYNYKTTKSKNKTQNTKSKYKYNYKIYNYNYKIQNQNQNTTATTKSQNYNYNNNNYNYKVQVQLGAAYFCGNESLSLHVLKQSERALGKTRAAARVNHRRIENRVGRGSTRSGVQKVPNCFCTLENKQERATI
jgi:hypothetical protein